ncbi:MAG: tryptophan-rich sensory protein [Methanoregulaceae archaeon]|nr:tryptophan-rich sensory protein [Methanoregulaceae archaeon]
MNGDQAKPRLIRSPARLVIAIVLCLAAGNIGTLVIDTGPGSWYDQLVKPDFTPSGEVIGLIWTVLFILMGIGLYLVWMEGTRTREAGTAMAVFGVQFALNILWTLLFFGLHSPFFGLAEILVLLLAILITIASFLRVRPAAAALLLPYILWTAFAAFLNYRIYVLNP